MEGSLAHQGSGRSERLGTGRVEIRQTGMKHWKAWHGTKPCGTEPELDWGRNSAAMIALVACRCVSDKVISGVGGPGLPTIVTIQVFSKFLF